MDAGEVSCGDWIIEVLRWLRTDQQLSVGVMAPFLVAKSDADFVRENQDEQWVVRLDDESWAMEIVSVEQTGTDGVWVSARAMGPIAPTLPDESAEIRTTLNGIPVPAVDD